MVRPKLFAGLLLIFAPAGSAGSADVSLEYLSGESGCSSSLDNQDYTDPDGTHWSAETWSNSCNDTFVYGEGTVSDETGPIATLSAQAVNESSEDGTWRMGTYYDDNGNYTIRTEQSTADSEGWAREASLDTTLASIGISHGCGSEYTTSYTSFDRWHYGPDGGFGSGTWTDDYRSTSGCHDTAAAEHAGRGAEGGWVTGCDDHSTGSGVNQYHYDSYSSSSTGDSSWDWSSICRTGVQAETAGVAGFGGYEASCSSHQSSSYWDYWSSSYNASESDEETETVCRDGAAVHGPDDIALTAGEHRSSWSYCSTHDGNETCYDSDEQFLGAGAHWEHNPLGPTHLNLYVVPVPELPDPEI